MLMYTKDGKEYKRADKILDRSDAGNQGSSLNTDNLKMARKSARDCRPKECVQCFSTNIHAPSDGWAFVCRCNECGYEWQERIASYENHDFLGRKNY